MKILHVVPTYAPAYRYGGPIHSVHALNKWLVRAGAHVTVYTTAIDGPKDLDVPLGQPVDLDGVTVIYFKPGWLRSWFYAPDMHRALRAHVRHFDLVHITSVFLAASTLAARAARAAGVPYVISPRGSLMRAPLEKKSALKKKLYMDMIERKNLENAAAIHFTVPSEKLEYEKLGYRLRRAIVIPNGLDADALPDGNPEAFRKKFGIPADKKIVLFLGRLSWKKGLDTLIPAFAILSKKIPQGFLVIAGGDDEGYRPTVQRLIETLKVAEKVMFTGPLEGPERTAAYRSAELFVLSSYAENFAGTVAEAMHLGVPVVISEEVGLAPLVRDSGSGLVVPKDAIAFAGGMIEIFKDPSRARAMGERGKLVARREFSYDKVAQGFLRAYNEIIQSRHVQ